MNQKMSIVLVILGSVILIIGLSLALRSVKPMYFNVIAGLIILIGSFFGLFGKQLQDKNSSEKSDKILRTGENAVEKIISLEDKVEKQAQTIDKLRTENTELYTKLSDANKEIYNNLTGGDSYCKMQIGNINTANDLGTLVFLVEGKNPLNNLQARIVDLDNFNTKTITLADLSRSTINIGTLDPDKALMTQVTITLDKEKGIRLNIFFGANNGFTTQAIRMKFVNGKWTLAERITRDSDGKQLFFKIDKDFPIQDEEKAFK
jgi:hypothetical protein